MKFRQYFLENISIDAYRRANPPKFPYSEGNLGEYVRLFKDRLSKEPRDITWGMKNVFRMLRDDSNILDFCRLMIYVKMLPKDAAEYLINIFKTLVEGGILDTIGDIRISNHVVQRFIQRKISASGIADLLVRFLRGKEGRDASMVMRDTPEFEAILNDLRRGISLVINYDTHNMRGKDPKFGDDEIRLITATDTIKRNPHATDIVYNIKEWVERTPIEEIRLVLENNFKNKEELNSFLILYNYFYDSSKMRVIHEQGC